MTDATINLKMNGAAAVRGMMSGLAGDGKTVATVFAASAKEATQLANALTKVKDGAASTWSPLISQSQQYAKSLRDISQLVTTVSKEDAAAAKQYEAFWKKAIAEIQRDFDNAAKSDLARQKALGAELARVTEAEMKAAGTAVDRFGNRLSDVKPVATQLTTALKGVGQAGKQLGADIKAGAGLGGEGMTALMTQAKDLNSAFQAVADNRSKFAALDQASRTSIQVGGGLELAGGGIFAGLGHSVNVAGEMQLQLETIGKFTGSEQTAREVYNADDKQAIHSVFNLTDLVQASKTFEKNRMYDQRRMTAADDLAAANKDEGVNANDVAIQFGRLKNGMTGRALLEFAKFGVNRQDLEAKGIKYDGRGALDDKTPAGINRAIDAITQVIEEKFGGLSERLATGTMTGSLSNLGDAIGRLERSIGEEGVGTITLFANGLTEVAGFFAEMPEPMKKIVFWGGVLLGTTLVLGGGLLIAAGMAGQLVIGLGALGFGMEAGAITTTGFATVITTTAIPALIGAIEALGLLGIIAYATTIAVNGTRDAAKMSNAELEKTYPFWSKIWGFVGAIASDFLFFLEKAAELVTYLPSKLTGGFIKQYKAGDTLDAENMRAQYEADKKGGRTTETYEAYKRRLENADKMGGKDGGDAAQTAADSKTTVSTGAGGAADLNRIMNQARSLPGSGGLSEDTTDSTDTAGDGSATKTTVTVSPGAMPVTNNNSTTVNMTTGALSTAMPSGTGNSGSNSGSDMRDLEMRAANGDKKAAHDLRIANLNKKWSREDAAAARKAEREQTKTEHSAAIEAGIDALSDGSDDVGNIKVLQAMLREARRQKNVVDVAVLSERIARAQDAATAARQLETAEKKSDAAEKRERLYELKRAHERELDALDDMRTKSNHDEIARQKRLLNRKYEEERHAIETGGKAGVSNVGGFGGMSGPTPADRKAAAHKRFLSQFQWGSTAAYGDGGERVSIGAGSKVAPLSLWEGGELDPAGLRRPSPMSGHELWAMHQLNEELPAPRPMPRLNPDQLAAAMRGGAAAEYRSGGAGSYDNADMSQGGGNGGPIELKTRVNGTQEGNDVRFKFVVEDYVVSLKAAPGVLTNRAFNRNVRGVTG